MAWDDEHFLWRHRFREGLKLKGCREDGFYGFISYSTRDVEYQESKDLVEGYTAHLRQYFDYIPVFLDKFYIVFHNVDLEEFLSDAILKSDFTTVFLSPGYTSSPWCAFEWWESRRIARNPPREKGGVQHKILSIKWKDVGGIDEEIFVRRSANYVDISAEFIKNKKEAAWKAASETLSFLAKYYKTPDSY